jgi:sterol desaturase/sphingolipid hydroxylase (fatty acid hydroxylase superfamily)
MGLGSGVAMAALSYATRTAMHPLLPSVFLLWTIFSQVMSNLQHSHLRTSFGPLNRIVMAGAMHHIHHSAELKHRDRNFGAMLCLFDWIFRTAYVPEPGETFRLGLSAEEIGIQNPYKRVIDVYAEPFAHARRVLKDRGLAV